MKELNKLVSSLEARFDRWEHLKKYGGQDPNWEDGYSMNLVRNHIINYKKQIEEYCEEKEIEIPDIYYRETPQKTDNKYMARADEIRKNAKIALSKYKDCKDYKYLLEAINKLSKKQIEQTLINNVIGYCRGLESFIAKDNLVAMRRHEHYKRYLESFKNCRNRVENILKEKPKQGQVSLFELLI